MTSCFETLGWTFLLSMSHSEEEYGCSLSQLALLLVSHLTPFDVDEHQLDSEPLPIDCALYPITYWEPSSPFKSLNWFFLPCLWCWFLLELFNVIFLRIWRLAVPYSPSTKFMLLTNLTNVVTFDATKLKRELKMLKLRQWMIIQWPSFKYSLLLVHHNITVAMQ